MKSWSIVGKCSAVEVGEVDLSNSGLPAHSVLHRIGHVPVTCRPFFLSSGGSTQSPCLHLQSRRSWCVHLPITVHWVTPCRKFVSLNLITYHLRHFPSVIEVGNHSIEGTIVSQNARTMCVSLSDHNRRTNLLARPLLLAFSTQMLSFCKKMRLSFDPSQ